MPSNSPWSTFVLIALMVLAFYFLIIRPQKKRQLDLQRTMNALTPGTRVMTGSGIFGTVVSVGERQAVLRIAPGVELTVLKQAIARIATEADEDGLTDEDLTEEQSDEPQATEPPANKDVPGTEHTNAKE